MNSKKWYGLVLLSMALTAVIVASSLIGDGGSSAASPSPGSLLSAPEPELIAVDVSADALHKSATSPFPTSLHPCSLAYRELS